MAELSPQSSRSRQNSWPLYTLLTVCVVFLAMALLWRSGLQPAAVVASPTASPGYDSRLSDPDVTFALTVNGAKLVSGPAAISVRKGDSVRVNITAQKGSPVEDVTLDGYGIDTEIDPTYNTPGGFSFIADHTGTFAFYANNETAKPPVQTKLGTITVK